MRSPEEARKRRRPTTELRDRAVTLTPGEVCVVPKGVEHRPVARDEVHLLLIEPTGTPNTGMWGLLRPGKRKRPALIRSSRIAGTPPPMIPEQIDASCVSLHTVTGLAD
jgi:hypothetical protein